MKLFLLCLLAIGALGSPRHRKDPPQIIGGTKAYQGQFPYQLNIRMIKTGSLFCGASIYDEYTAITASHCVIGQEASELKVVAGDLYKRDESEYEQESNVIKIIMHEGYNPTTNENDIALLKLGTPLKFNSNVQPVVLPSRHEESKGNCIVSGWGTKKSGAFVGSRDLMYVSVPLVSDAKCAQDYEEYNTIFETNMCAGEEGKDSCQGDSGGPLVCENENGQYLAGVVSWGVGCGFKDLPGVYAQVSYYLDWIILHAK